MITKILSERISSPFRAVCCCARGVSVFWELGRQQKTRHIASPKCKYSMDFDLFQQTAFFLGKIFNNPQEVLMKTRTGYCQMQDSSLSKARGKYLFCLTLQVIQFEIDLLRWVPLLLGQKLIVRKFLVDPALAV